MTGSHDGAGELLSKENVRRDVQRVCNLYEGVEAHALFPVFYVADISGRFVYQLREDQLGYVVSLSDDHDSASDRAIV